MRDIATFIIFLFLFVALLLWNVRLECRRTVLQNRIALYEYDDEQRAKEQRLQRQDIEVLERIVIRGDYEEHDQ